MGKYCLFFLNMDSLKAIVCLTFFTWLCHVKILSIITPKSFSCAEFFICVPSIFMLRSVSFSVKHDYFAFDRINIALVFSKLKAMSFS